MIQKFYGDEEQLQEMKLLIKQLAKHLANEDLVAASYARMYIGKAINDCEDGGYFIYGSSEENLLLEAIAKCLNHESAQLFIINYVDKCF